jgi:hypothetical protein
MTPRLNKLPLFLGTMGLFFLLAACGSEMNLDPSQGTATEIPAAEGSVPIPPGDSTPQEYFELAIHPLLISAGKGCTACHNLENPNELPAGYFVVVTDPAASWPWAEPRRDVLDLTDVVHTNNQAQTLRTQALAGHETFQNWSSGDRALLDAWTNLPDSE